LDHAALQRGLSPPAWDWNDAELIDRYSEVFDVDDT